MRWIRFLRSVWRSRQRQMDVLILWPACREQAPDIETARAAFAAHAYHDPAWLELEDAHIKRIIEALQ